MLKKILVIFIPIILIGSCGFYIRSTGIVDGRVLGILAMATLFIINIRKW